MDYGMHAVFADPRLVCASMRLILVVRNLELVAQMQRSSWFSLYIHCQRCYQCPLQDLSKGVALDCVR